MKKTIVLSTSTGRYKVKGHIKYWTATHDFFKNYYTSELTPFRLEYNGKSYGPDVLFLIRIKTPLGDEVISVSKDDYKHNVLKKFRFTEESLATKDTLVAFLENQKRNGLFDFEEYEVLDFHKAVKKEMDRQDSEPVMADNLNFYQYSIVGRFQSFFENWKEDRDFKRRLQKNKQKLSKRKK